MIADKFLGLSKKDSQNLADINNLIFRLIRIDDKNFLPYPEDQREDRICIEIEKSVVVRATIQ